MKRQLPTTISIFLFSQTNQFQHWTWKQLQISVLGVRSRNVLEEKCFQSMEQWLHNNWWIKQNCCSWNIKQPPCYRQCWSETDIRFVLSIKYNVPQEIHLSISVLCLLFLILCKMNYTSNHFPNTVIRKIVFKKESLKEILYYCCNRYGFPSTIELTMLFSWPLFSYISSIDAYPARLYNCSTDKHTANFNYVFV